MHTCTHVHTHGLGVCKAMVKAATTFYLFLLPFFSGYPSTLVALLLLPLGASCDDIWPH